jgi:hypothetical protein
MHIKCQHTLLLLSQAPLLVDGAAFAWGSGLSGQLGNGSQESRLLPTRMVVEGQRPFKAFAARGGECAPPAP